MLPGNDDLASFSIRAGAVSQHDCRVLFGHGSRRSLGIEMQQLFGERPFVLAADAQVKKLWGEELLGLLPAPLGVFETPSGEAAKTADCLIELCRDFTRVGLPRDGIVVAFGGGAAGDLIGLAASLHKRGVALVQVPTSLLAMVDAGLGGKTAINLPEGKNLLGSFHPASLVLVDPDFLSTLPDEEFNAGLGEIAKYALGFSREILDLCLSMGSCQAIRENPRDLILACLKIKAAIVSQDMTEQEGGQRILLNLGHSIAHALEAQQQARGRTVAHGLAVALGLRVALRISRERGLLSIEELELGTRVLDTLDLPRKATQLAAEDLAAQSLLPYLRHDKKRRAGRTRMVLLDGLCSCKVQDVDEREVLTAIQREL